MDLEKKNEELNKIEKQIRGAKRELLPLTVGKINEIKRNRALKLREKVRKDGKAVLKLQSFWRYYQVCIIYCLSVCLSVCLSFELEINISIVFNISIYFVTDFIL